MLTEGQWDPVRWMTEIQLDLMILSYLTDMLYWGPFFDPLYDALNYRFYYGSTSSFGTWDELC